MTIRAVVFDLDDTLLREDRTLSAYTLSVLRRASAQGIFIIPASGRARDSMKAFVEQIGCVDVYLACNGAEVWRGSDHVCLVRETLTVPLARECARFAHDRDCYAQCYDGAHFYYSLENEYARQYAAESMLTGRYVGDLEAFITTPTSKLLMMAAPEKVTRMMAEAHAQFDGRASVTGSKPYFLEINPLRATKGIALSRAGELLGFDLADCAAFGDSLNDLSMLTAAGLGVAMSNARDEVKARVSTVCGANTEDGVAHYIEEHLLQA